MPELDIKASKAKTLLVLFIPFVLNWGISSIISASVYKACLVRGVPPNRISVEIMKVLYTYNFYWSIIQVGLGLYAAKLLGKEKLKEFYTKNDLASIRSMLLMIALVLISQGIIMSEIFIMSFFYSGWENYMKVWQEVVRGVPLWSKIYLVCIAPFTAGIFEEIIWRGFGITALEKFTKTRTALVIQAVAFGLWHGLSFHAIITFIIGLIYGYVFIKRRRLLLLTASHIITDVIGFGLAFLR